MAKGTRQDPGKTGLTLDKPKTKRPQSKRDWDRENKEQMYTFRADPALKAEISSIAEDHNTAASDILRAFFYYALDNYLAGNLKLKSEQKTIKGQKNTVYFE